MSESERVLVVGARPQSLGDAVAAECVRRGYAAYTAGIQGEQIALDLLPTGTGMERLRETLANLQPKHIVCTVGFNMVGPPVGIDPFDWYRWHMETNCIAPMRLLEAWTQALEEVGTDSAGHYVAISSNSARLPRTRSAAYCASKAALSMALRVRAREVSGAPVIYGYEPGLLRGTPMTRKASEAIDGPMTRMKPKALRDGIDPYDLAKFIVETLGHNGLALNGSLIPYSADEL